MTTPAHIETFISIVVGLALSDVAHSPAARAAGAPVAK
jgi:hypothetical protein